MGSCARAWILAGWLFLLLAGVATAAEGDRLQAVVEAAHARFVSVEDGELADYIPALANADSDAFGIVVVTVDGTVSAEGDVTRPFAIMSAAKPFTLALLLEQQGLEPVVDAIGVEPTGLPFNSLTGIDRSDGRQLNPMVNPGAITTVSLLQADSAEQRWALLRDFFSRLAGEQLEVMKDVYTSVSSSNYRNRAVVNLLAANDRLQADPDETLDIYNRQSSVAVNTMQLAVMGATLANGGRNPLTGVQVMHADNVDEVLAIMMLAGMYDESGAWAIRAGLPAKSGVGGGIVAIAPGKLAIAAFSPRLSQSGNSVRAMSAIEYVSQELGLSLFSAEPDPVPSVNRQRQQ